MALPTAVLTVLPASPASAVACAPTSSTASGVVTLTFSSAGACDWSVPTGVTVVDVLVVGGGGGGSGAVRNSNTLNLGGNGGGGGFVNLDTNFSVSGTVSLTVGAGGTGGAPATGGSAAGAGTDGGSSSFGSVTAQGGTGGVSTSASTSGATTTQGGSSGSTIDGGAPTSYSGGSSATPGTYFTYTLATGGAGAGAGGNGGNATYNPSGTSGSAGIGGIGFIPSAGLFSGTSTGYGGGGAGGFAKELNSGGSATSYGAYARMDGSGAVSGSTYYLDAAVNGGGGAGGSARFFNPDAAWRGGAGGTGVVVVKYAEVPVAPTFTASTPPTTGTAGTAYVSYTFTASGTTPITFTVDSGSLPTGLSLSSGGVLSGTPTVTGAYTFAVKAANGTAPDATTASITITIAAAGGGGGGGGGSSSGGGSSEASESPSASPSASAPAVMLPNLDPIPNRVNGNVLAGGVPAGGSVYLVDGVPVPVTVSPNAQRDATGLDVSGPDFTMKLSGTGDDADPLGLGERSQLLLQSPVVPQRRSGVGQLRSAVVAVAGSGAGVVARSGSREPRSGVLARCVLRTPMAVSSGTGFQANSPVKLYILPATYIGTLTTDASGSYSGSLPVPAGVTAGSQTLQANGFTKSGGVRSLSLGITVIPARVVSTASEKARLFFAPLSPVISAAGKKQLNALARKAKKHGVRTVVVGFVQRTSSTGNDRSLSTLRARNVAAYLRGRGLTGAYVIRGDGVAGSGDAARRVNVTVTYQTGC